MRRGMFLLIGLLLAVGAAAAYAQGAAGHDRPAAGGDAQSGHGLSPAQPAGESAAPGTVQEAAPIDRVELITAKSLPPQYSVRVNYGLRNGCIKPGGYDVERQGHNITVKLWVLAPSDPATVCTQVYGAGEETIPLGGDLERGADYTVTVNDETLAFTAG